MIYGYHDGSEQLTRGFSGALLAARPLQAFVGQQSSR
jgi:hypothetical protein